MEESGLGSLILVFVVVIEFLGVFVAVFQAFFKTADRATQVLSNVGKFFSAKNQ